MTKIKPLTLNIEKKTWEEFKSNLDSSKTANGTIVKLIEDYNKDTSL